MDRGGNQPFGSGRGRSAHATSFTAALDARVESFDNPWLRRDVPVLVADCCLRWNITLAAEEILQVAPSACVFGGRDRLGRDLVLKIQHDRDHSAREALSLHVWAGQGAVRLHHTDADRGALVMERGGHSLLATHDVDAGNAVAIHVLLALWKPLDPRPPLRALSVIASGHASRLPSRFESAIAPYSPALHAGTSVFGTWTWGSLIDRAAESFDQLSRSTEDAVLLHYDFWHGNIVAVRRAGADGSTQTSYAAIDPKGVVGERAADLTGLVRERLPELLVNPDQAPREFARRIEHLSAATVCDPSRVYEWSFAELVQKAVRSFVHGDNALGRDRFAAAELLVTCDRAWG